MCSSNLTQRKVEILQLVAAGKSNKEVARALKISDQTVKNHLTEAMIILDVVSRTAAVVVALQRGLITVEGLFVCPCSDCEFTLRALRA